MVLLLVLNQGLAKVIEP